MIDFTINGKSLAKFPLFRWKNAGNYFMRLDGIDIVISSGAVTPVYRSLFSTENHPGQFVLHLVHRRLRAYVHFPKDGPVLPLRKIQIRNRGAGR